MKRTPIRRKIRIKLRDPKRLARLRAEQFGPQAALCRTLPCCACGKPGPSDPHHLRSRGAGGLDDSCIPICRGCHACLHMYGVDRFEGQHGIRLSRVLERMQALVRGDGGDDLPVSVMLGRPSP